MTSDYLVASAKQQHSGPASDTNRKSCDLLEQPDNQEDD
jgi:hypothetical protein